MVDFTRFKIQPDAISLDDYAITLRDGTEIAPNEGESVWVLPIGLSFGALTALQKYQAMAGGTITDGDPRIESAFDELLGALADIIVAWDITDVMGEPYEQPYHNPDALRALPAGLLFHILSELRGIAPEDAEGKSSPPRSVRGSSATTRRMTRVR